MVDFAAVLQYPKGMNQSPQTSMGKASDSWSIATSWKM